MAGIRQRSTAPELAVQRVLRTLGRRHRINNRDLPGSPDLTNRPENWVIFVHGCFWHRHTHCQRTTTPTRNREAWEEKFTANVTRDRRKASALRRLGYSVFTVWECETIDPTSLEKRIRGKLAKADAKRCTGRPPTKKARSTGSKIITAATKRKTKATK
jgi:DNA mismatch endonuclease (patch repair protein)